MIQSSVIETGHWDMECHLSDGEGTEYPPFLESLEKVLESAHTRDSIVLLAILLAIRVSISALGIRTHVVDSQ